MKALGIQPHPSRKNKYAARMGHPAVFASFLQHLIQAGLVDSAYKPLVEAAQNSNSTFLLQSHDAVASLVNAVKQLYAIMDNSLRFSGKAVKVA